MRHIATGIAVASCIGGAAPALAQGTPAMDPASQPSEEEIHLLIAQYQLLTAQYAALLAQWAAMPPTSPQPVQGDGCRLQPVSKE